MKIVFVTSSLSTGGAERVAAELSQELSKRHEVFVVITSIRQKEVYSCGQAKISYLSASKKITPFSKIRALKRFLKFVSPDVVVAFPDPCSFYAARACADLHVPCICSERNAPQFAPSKRVMRFLRTESYRLASAVVFQTDEARSFFSKSIQNKGVLIPNPFEARPQLPRNPEKLIVSFGRLMPQKNYHCLIEAFSLFVGQHPDYRLEIYGDGPQRDMLTQYIDSLHLGSSIFLKGFVDNLANPLSRASVFVMSSDHEGMPNALLEAAAAGVPCVSTDCPVGGPRFLIGNNHFDQLVPINDPSAISSAINSIVENYSVASKGCAEYADTLKKNLSLQTIVEKWELLMQKVILGKKNK